LGQIVLAIDLGAGPGDHFKAEGAREIDSPRNDESDTGTARQRKQEPEERDAQYAYEDQTGNDPRAIDPPSRKTSLSLIAPSCRAAASSTDMARKMTASVAQRPTNGLRKRRVE
jgi:hypothetical protein